MFFSIRVDIEMEAASADDAAERLKLLFDEAIWDNTIRAAYPDTPDEFFPEDD